MKELSKGVLAMATKVSSTYLYHAESFFSAVSKTSFSNFSWKRLVTTGHQLLVAIVLPEVRQCLNSVVTLASAVKKKESLGSKETVLV